MSPQCPNCKAQIDCLGYRGKVYEYADFDGEDYLDWDRAPTEDHDPIWFCTVCDEILFTEEDKARDFLRK